MTDFRERWRVPLTWWFCGTAVSLGAAAEIDNGAGGWRWVLYVVLPGVMLLALALLSREQVCVRDGQLHVPGARAPLTAFGRPTALDAASLRQWRGPRAQRDGWVTVRPWLRTGVLLPITDPADDTPYWLIGTRHPEALIAALR